MLSNLAPDIYATINLKEIQFEFQLNTIASSQSFPLPFVCFSLVLLFSPCDLGPSVFWEHISPQG